MNKKPVAVLLQKEMSRKEFLTTLGFGAASLLGFSSILHFLTGKNATSHLRQKSSASGYGSSSYGN